LIRVIDVIRGKEIFASLIYAGGTDREMKEGFAKELLSA